MIVCPNCLHKEMEGALFCSECGARLFLAEGIPTGTIKQTTGQVRPRSAPFEVASSPSSQEMKVPVALNLLASGDILPLTFTEEIILGRYSEGQPVKPDVDLTPFHAYEAGVSRLHASLRWVEDRLMVTDLGSANGTRLNGRLLTAYIPYPLKHGDILTMGKFKIQVLLRSP